MKLCWPLVFKICWIVLCGNLISGLVYRFIYLQGAGINLDRFLAYISVAILLLASDRALKHFVLKNGKKAVYCKVPQAYGDETQELKNEFLGMFWGVLGAILRLPLFLVFIAPIGALWDQKWADGFEELFLNLLGLGAMTDTASKLAFFSAWFMIGTLILYLGLRLQWLGFKANSEL